MGASLSVFIGRTGKNVMTHPLIDMAKRRRWSDAPDLPAGAKYDLRRGYWMLHGSPLVLDDEHQIRNVSKKCDQETGEDQKGE